MLFFKKTLEWNLNFDPNDIVIKCSSINFHSWKLLLYNLLIQEHCRLCRLAILYDISKFFKPPTLQSLQVVSCLIFGMSLSKENIFVFSLGRGFWLKELERLFSILPTF